VRETGGSEFMTADLLWSKNAACQGLDASVFYPVSEEDADAAKAICDVCRSKDQCLEFALARREHNGVWGGATERERRRILRQRQRAARQAKLLVLAEA